MRRFEPLLVALALGLAVLVLVGGRDVGDVPADPAPVAAPAPAPVVEVVAAPAAEVTELSPSISSVLAAAGHTGFVARDVLEDSLPPSVVTVLVDRGVVLRIPEGTP